MKKQLFMSLTAMALCASFAISALAEGETSRPSVFATTEVVSRKLSRGLPDHTDPIFTQTAGLEWMGVFASVKGHFNMSDVEEDKGFDRWENKEIDYKFGFNHTFDKDAIGLGTALALGADYVFEFDQGGLGENDHIQYIHMSLGLPDVFLSPTLASEWMLDQFHGQYFTLDLSHSFPLLSRGGDDAKPILALKLSFRQGLANAKYNDHDLDKDFWALRESTFTATFDWNVCENVTISPYAAYGDTYSGTVRPAAHFYEDPDESNDVAQFYGGVTLNATF